MPSRKTCSDSLDNTINVESPRYARKIFSDETLKEPAIIIDFDGKNTIIKAIDNIIIITFMTSCLPVILECSGSVILIKALSSTNAYLVYADAINVQIHFPNK